MSRPSRQRLEAAPIFAALGDETRLRLVARLSTDGPLSITHLATDAATTRQSITKHLRVLADAGLVHHTRKGREQIYQLAPDRLTKAQAYLNDISAQWDLALSRLRNFVES